MSHMRKVEADTTVLVIGAGIMGAGIAQVAAQAGHPVLLYDTRSGAAAQAIEKLQSTFDALVSKGKRTREDVAETMARLKPIETLEGASRALLVVEAIVENLGAKRELFQRLEDLVSPDCILATNTSSISVTAIANGLKRPGQLVGMHFFNPVPLMKLVEVVSGLRTEPGVAEAIFDLSVRWGKVPVHARSTPGFIVNRVARPFYAETLAMLGEQAAAPAVLDACLRGAGFRMGPCELMDLIGHDTNFAVTSSVYEANFFDKRFVPSLVQRELVEGGLLGRKSKQGFFDYSDGASTPVLSAVMLAPLPADASVTVHGRGPVAERWAAALKERKFVFREEDSDWIGITVGSAQLRLTDGRCAGFLQAQERANVAVFDWPVTSAPEAALAWAPAACASTEWVNEVPSWLALIGVAPVRVKDCPGLVVARTLSMLVNEAADAVHQGVCSPEAVDAAMKLGVNYPAGPFEWLVQWQASAMVQVLRALDVHYRGERYRVSPELLQRLWARGESTPGSKGA